MVAAHQHVGHGLIHGLLINIECSIPVGHEDDFFAVGGPVERHVLAIIERQTLWFSDDGRTLQLAHVYVGLRHAPKIAARKERVGEPAVAQPVAMRVGKRAVLVDRQLYAGTSWVAALDDRVNGSWVRRR